MMRLRGTILVTVSSLFTFVSCNPSESKLVGIYVASHHENTIDSLYIFENNYYKHSIYSQEDKSNIHTQYGTWAYEQGFIDLKKFYGNDDKVYKENIDYEFSKNYMLTNTPVNSFFSKVTIDINSDMGNLYEKILSDEADKVHSRELEKTKKLPE